MAAEVAETKEPLNPCCQLWRDKYLNCHEKRNALRQAVKLLEPKISMFQAENLSLKKACEEERARAEIEQEGRKKELAGRVLLENEISALKSELSLLQKKVGSNTQNVGEVKLLEIRISEGEKEIEHLKKVLEKEKIRADAGKKHAELEKKNAIEAWKCVEAEKARADEERKHLIIEGNKAEKYRLQLEASCKELVSAKSKLEEMKKCLEAEKQKVSKERKRADSEMAKVEEQRKLAEASTKQAEEEKCRAENSSRHLEEARLQIVELQKEIQDIASRYSGKINTAVPSDLCLSRDSEKLKLFKKQLKFEKMQVKHAKQVAKWEKSRNSFLQQELGRLRLEFVQFLHHLDVVNKCFAPNAEGIDNLGSEKVMDYSNMQNLKLKETLDGVERFQMYLESKIELPNSCCTDIATASPVRQAFQHIAPSLSLSGGICSESISGINSEDSKLESLLGGSSQKMLQSCAINSSSASFSDGQLMGSQGRGSVTTSSKLIEESLNAQATNSSLSGEVNRMRCDGKLALDAENSVRSPPIIGGTRKTNGSGRKKKRIINVMESIELLHSQDRKLHSQIEEKLSELYKLNKQVNKSLEKGNYAVPNLNDTSYVKHEQVPKKKKASHRENLGIQHFCDGGEPKRTKHVDSKVHEDARTFKQTSGSANDLIGTAQACTEGISGSVISHLETLTNFEEVAIGDYMKLLDLDNPVDEECYRTAMEMPLSPTLPEIEFRAVETFVSDKFEPLVEERFYGGLSKAKENPVPSCGFDVINVEIISNELNNNAFKYSHDSLFYENEGPLDSCDAKMNSENIFCSAMQAEKAFDNRAPDFEVERAASNLCRSGDEVVEFPFESELGPARDNIPEHFVVFHNIKDKNSISRILHATKTCMARCSLVMQTDWILQKILLALRMEEHLLSEEKACVFFSLSLLNFSTAARKKSMNFLNSDIIQCLDSFVSHVTAVMSDGEARSVFDKLCLDEFLSLIEDFLMNGKILITDVSSETLNECDSKINVLLDGLNVALSAEAASSAQLVAGSIILASISVATDRIGFICDASYNIFRIRRCDPSLVLTVLHIFAYLGGEKIFTSRKYNLTMTVLKSIIMSLERGCLSVAADSSVSSASEIQAKFHPCAECPFSNDAVSVEIAISLLLEKLKSYSELPDFQSNSIVDITLCHATDVISLVELLAGIMRWDWTCNTVVPEILRLLESPIAKSFTLAIVILLGHLGRLGVDGCGYEDKNVEILRNRLSAFLLLEATGRAGLPLQIATVTALLGLLSFNFEQVIQINMTSPSVANQSVPADSIRKWFSSLSNEHQALSFSFLQCCFSSKTEVSHSFKTESVII